MAPVRVARKPGVQLLLIGLVVALGLGSRHFHGIVPAFLGKYPGDALWATMVYFGLGLVRPRASWWALATAALAISYAVEFGQLYQAAWITAIRSNPFGQLVLGTAFNPPDLIAYAVGIGLAVGYEFLFSTLTHPPKATP